MPLFEQAVTINAEEVAAVLQQHWQLTLGSLIKASQNHTFKASRLTPEGQEQFFSVRVTPDLQHKHQSRIEREIQFVSFVQQRCQAPAFHIHICGPVPSRDGSLVIRAHDLVFVVFDWAKGSMLDFFDARWRTDPAVGFTWGRSLAELHQLSQLFHAEHPEETKLIQRWDEVHECIAKDTPLAAEDVAVMADPAHYGILHGDLNISNFFLQESEDQEKTLSIFDWDQAQQGWYLLDLAQAEFGIYMLAEGGSLVDGSKVEDAIPERFEQSMVDGYESVFGQGHVDRERLKRMVEMRMYFYETFCRTAKSQGELPADMAFFVDYVIRWFDKKKGLLSESV